MNVGAGRQNQDLLGWDLQWLVRLRPGFDRHPFRPVAFFLPHIRHAGVGPDFHPPGIALLHLLGGF